MMSRRYSQRFERTAVSLRSTARGRHACEGSDRWDGRDAAAYSLGLEELHAESVRKQGAECRGFLAATFAGIKNDDIIVAEFAERLPAGAAGHRGGAIQVGHGNRTQPNVGSALGDSPRNGGLLGATGKTVGTVFDIAAGHDGAIGKQKCSADPEVAVR